MPARIAVSTVTAVALTALVGVSASAVQDDDAGVVVKLEQVKELRVLDVVPTDEGFSMFDQPGLELRFGLSVAGGRTVVEVRDPTEVEATDSSGTDLSELPKNVFDQRDYVDVVQEWDKPPSALTFKLGLPARAATSFSLAARMDVVTFLDTVETTLRPTAERTEVSVDSVEGTVTVRLEKQSGGTHLVFAPGTVKEHFEAVRLGTLDSQGTMWNDQQVSYMFDGAPGDDVVATVTVRRGLEVIPLEIRITDQPLP